MRRQRVTRTLIVIDARSPAQADTYIIRATMRSRRTAAFCAAILFIAPPAFAQVTLYEGARLIPGDGKPAIERSTSA